MTSQQRRVAGHACTRQQEERKGDPESHFSSKDTDLPAAWRSAPPGATERVSFLESEKGQRLRAQVEGTLVRKYVGLQHPNLVAVNDVRDDGGGVVAVREDFDGDSLPAAGGTATELRDVLLLVEQILTALAFLHAQGLVHGDVSAENVLVRGGRVKLTGFGVVATADSAADVDGAAAIFRELLGQRPLPLAVAQTAAMRFSTAAAFLETLRGAAVGFLPTTIVPEQIADEEVPTLTVAMPRARGGAALAWSIPTAGAGLVVVYLIARQPAPPAPSPPAVVTIVEREPQTPPSAPVTITTTAAAPPVAQPAPQPQSPPAREPVAESPPPRAPQPRVDIAALRADVAHGIALAQGAIEQSRFDAAQEEIERLDDKTRAFADDLRDERNALHDLRKRLVDAQVAEQTRNAKKALEEAAWQRQLTDIREQLDAGQYVEARNKAKSLAGQPGIPDAVAGRARELLGEAQSGLARVFSETRTGPTTNKIRKPN